MPTAWELNYVNYPVRSCKILFINYRLKSMTIRYFRISISNMKSIFWTSTVITKSLQKNALKFWLKFDHRQTEMCKVVKNWFGITKKQKNIPYNLNINEMLKNWLLHMNIYKGEKTWPCTRYLIFMKNVTYAR